MGLPLIVLGFGRSGTTWLADILSRVTGRWVLFEPLHPSVTAGADAWSYRRELPDVAADHLRQVAAKQLFRPWLMRNHLPARIENTSPQVIEYLWQHAKIGGWKEIRMNFAIPWLARHELGQMIFITRHPYAVVASILNRHNFWEFQGGMKAIYERIVAASGYAVDSEPGTDIEYIATMWALTHAIALPDCIACGVPVFTYEHLEADPIGTIEHLMNVCDLEARPVHPSYFLTASLTTSHDNVRFWQRRLTPGERDLIDATLERFGVRYPPLTLAPAAESAS